MSVGAAETTTLQIYYKCLKGGAIARINLYNNMRTAAIYL